MMFIQPDINVLAVIAGAVIVMIVGSIWYSPNVFFTLWVREMGKKLEEVKPGASVFITMFVGALVQSYVLANIVRAFGATSVVQGGMIGVFVWFGIVAMTMIGNYAFAGRSRNVYLIDAGYYLVTFTLLSMLHAVWM